jgi:serine protease
VNHFSSVPRGLAQFCFAALSTAAISCAAMSAAHAEGPPQRIILKYRTAPQAADSLGETSRRIMSDATSRFGIAMSNVRKGANGAQIMRLDSKLEKAEMAQLVKDLAADPNVEYAEEDRMMQPLLTPNDPSYSVQWHYYETTGGLNLPTAWDRSTGTGVIVAVIDTGYRPHADLAANIVGGYDMISDTFVSRDGNGRDSSALDPGDWTTGGDCGANAASNSSWHGTHVAGTIAARTNNSVGVAGVAYNARVLPVRVLGRCGGYTSDIADGIVWASGGAVSGVPTNPNPAKVASLSLGGQGACDTTTQNAVNTARSRGTVVIVAAGNSNANASGFSPSNCTGVITVAATNRSGGRAYYSNFGSIVDVAAPGGDTRTSSANGVASTLNNGTTTPGSDAYAYYQGTSMATPHVSGVAALMFAVKPTLTPAQVESILKSTTRAFPATCSQCGTGIVNAAAAVAAAAAQ